jgi:hypothetical protein
VSCHVVCVRRVRCDSRNTTRHTTHSTSFCARSSPRTRRRS